MSSSDWSGAGLATREPSEADRRAQVVRITEEGRVFVRQVRPLMEEAQDKFVSPLTKEERKVFMRLLSKLIRANNDASRAPMK